MNAAPQSAALRVVLALYPRAWRERYGEEMADLLADRRATPALLADLLRGAADAHLHPTEVLGESPATTLGRSLAGVVQSLVLSLLVVAGVTKASEDTGLASGTAVDLVHGGAALGLAGLVVLAAPAALAVRRGAWTPGPARRRVAACAVASLAFAAATAVLVAAAPRLGPAAGHAAFWVWTLSGMLAALVAGRTAATLAAEHAPAGVVARVWPAAWLTAGGGLLTLAGVTAWSLSAIQDGAGLGGAPPSVVALGGTLACIAAAAWLWRCVRAGQHAREALAARG